MIRPLSMAIVAAMLISCESSPRQLHIVIPDGDIDREIVEDLVSLFDETAPVRLLFTDEPMTGGAALEALSEGRADIALISNDQPYRDDIATIMPLYSTVLHIVRSGDETPENADQLLRGASIYAGQEGSASRRVLKRLTANIDFGDQPYRFVTDRSVDVDVAVIFAPIAPQRLAEYTGVRLWSMGEPADIGSGSPIDGAVLLNPHFRPFVIPSGTYGNAADGPVVTIAVDKLIVAREDLDETIVYDLINEILKVRPALASDHPGLFHDLSRDFDVSHSRFVLHEGTQAYLQRSEPTFVERYSGVAEVLVTLMIALISATLAGVRIFNRKRKNRIDRFYSAATKIRNGITPDMTEQAHRSAGDALQELQDEAFELLVDEKLAADESFSIFITLCNDVQRHLDATSPRT